MSTTYRQYQVRLVTQEPFRIGALQDVMSGIHNPVATVGNRAVVQGSSLKGALRANVEGYLIDRYGSDPAMKPCIPTPFKELSADEQVLIRNGLYREGGGCMYSERHKSESICPCCYLFGAQGLVGVVRVPYLYSEATPEQLYAVRIDRATGVVAEGQNRDLQLIPDGAEFVGTLEVLSEDTARGWKLGQARPLATNAEFHGDRWLQGGKWNAERILKELVVERLTNLHLLGGFKSRGFGRVQITVEAR